MNVEIYTEYTPNPDSLKFVVNRRLLPDNSIVEARSSESAIDIPLAAALFERFDFVKGVFIAANFITITKNNPQTAWIELVPDVKAFLKQYVSENKPIATIKQEATQPEASTDIEAKIVNILDLHVRPAVEMDGGNIRFKSYKDGVVTVVMQGSCSGCPSSTLTLKAGIEGLLKRMVPEVTEVVAETE